MSFALVDTNILLRGAQPTHAMHQEAINAQQESIRRGKQPCLVAQNIVEFRAVATRPAAVNGLGMSQATADGEMTRLKRLYPLFLDAPTILAQWEYLVGRYGSEGKQNHDARIVAAMMVHGITTLLTFNKVDFLRYPDITVLTPQDVLAAKAGTPPENER